MTKPEITKKISTPTQPKGINRLIPCIRQLR